MKAKADRYEYARTTFTELRLPDWRLSGQTVGSGAQSAVCTIQRTSDGQHAVFRCLIDPADGTARARFRRETEALAGVSHPNVLRLIASGETWYISELGKPLDLYWGSFVKTHGLIDLEEESLRIVSGIAAGLAACHIRGLVHRDIKPANIVVYSRDGVSVPVLIDFGVVWVDGAERLTEQGSAVGNARYAPDALRTRSDTCPPWVDVFELVQVFQWMMSELDEKHYWKRPTHWRYVEYPAGCSVGFVNAIRALGAAGSSESTAPKDGAELCVLIDQLFARGAVELTAGFALGAEASAAIAAGQQRINLQRAQDQEVIDASHQVASIMYDELKEALEAWAAPPLTITHSRRFNQLFTGDMNERVMLELTFEVPLAGSFSVQMRIEDFVPSRWPDGGKPLSLEDTYAYVCIFQRVPKRIAAGGQFPSDELRFAIERDGTISRRDEHWSRIERADTHSICVELGRWINHPQALTAAAAWGPLQRP